MLKSERPEPEESKPESKPEPKPEVHTSDESGHTAKPSTSTSTPPAKKAAPVLQGTGNASSADVQNLASRRAHLAGALASGPASDAIADEIEEIDAALAELGYKA
jgi:hypothetical protein